MTSAAQNPERFPLGSALTWLSLAAALIVAAGWLALNMAMGHEAGAALALIGVMGLVNWLTACLGATLVAAVARFGGLMVMVAYFTGASVRLMVNLLAVGLLHQSQPAAALLVALAMAYLPLLVVEAALIAQYLWRQGGQATSAIAPAGPHRPNTITEAVA